MEQFQDKEILKDLRKAFWLGFFICFFAVLALELLFIWLKY